MIAFLAYLLLLAAHAGLERSLLSGLQLAGAAVVYLHSYLTVFHRAMKAALPPSHGGAVWFALYSVIFTSMTFFIKARGGGKGGWGGVGRAGRGLPMPRTPEPTQARSVPGFAAALTRAPRSASARVRATSRPVAAGRRGRRRCARVLMCACGEAQAREVGRVSPRVPPPPLVRLHRAVHAAHEGGRARVARGAADERHG